MRIIMLLVLFAAVFSLTSAQPLSGIKTIPGDFANLQTAVDSLNVLGAGTGGVTFQVAAGQIFNLTANTFALKITATGTAASPIVFEKTGSGANPLLNVTGSSGTTDAGVWLSGTDYITFDGIDISNAGTSTNNYLEYGFYLAGTATDGCQHITLKNCTVRMVSAYSSAYGIYALSTATAAGGKNSFNTIQNVTVKNSIRGIQYTGITGFEDYGNVIQQVKIDSCGVSGSTMYGINMLYQDSAQVVGSTFSNFIGNSMYALQLNYSGNFSVLNDTIRNLVNGTSGTVYGIYIPNSFGLNWVKGNVVHNVSSSGGGINPIFRQIGSSTNTITENTIYDISGTFTGGQIFGIIARDGTAVDYIHRNKVYNLTSAGNLGAIGVLYTSAATNVEYVYNNIVYDLKGPATTSTYMITGFYFIGGAVKCYYNTCLFGYTSTSGTNTSAALYVNPANGTTLDARNNILINTTDATTGTRAAAFWWAGTSYTNLASTCNNNLFYTGTPGAKNVIFCDGTNADQTLVAYKARVTPRETASVTEMPPFISSVSPFNLHITPGLTTQTESGGQQITTPLISTDFDSEVRFGHAGYTGNGTAPDIGADEFSVLITDAGIIGITSPSDSICPGSAPVGVVLKNFGPFALTSVRINWTMNGIQQPQYIWNGNLPVNSTDTVTIGAFNFQKDSVYVVQTVSSFPNYVADTAAWNNTFTKNNLYVKSPPKLNIGSQTIQICAGDTAHITGTLTGTPPWTLHLFNGTTLLTFPNITNPAFDIPVMVAATTQVIIQSITDGGGCPNLKPDTIMILVNPAPPASITPSGTSAFCEGDSVVLMGTIGLNFSYQWKKDGVNIQGANNFIYAASQGGAYTVQITSNIGCSSISPPVTVIMHPNPVIFLGSDTTVGPMASISLNAGSGFASYLWSTGSSGQMIVIDSSGTGLGKKTVWVVVTDNNGCHGSDTIKITFVANPGIVDVLSENYYILYPNPVSGTLTLIPQKNADGEILFELYNLEGRKVKSLKLSFNHTSPEVSVDLSDLPEGVYYLQVLGITGNNIFKTLIIKQ
jgi:hypothetical protein